MKIIELNTVDSTNIYAKLNIKNLNDKTVIHALHQTNGRGRLNRSWIDFGEGNLFFSIVLKPSKDFKSIYSNLTQYACICLCNILDGYNINPKVKWPNDVMIDGQRKISGILSETVFENGELQGIVIGIGVNLVANIQDTENVPDKIVTALNLETGEIVPSIEFLNKFLNEFFKNYEDFLEKGFKYIENDYIKRNCFLNKNLNIQVLNEIKTGYATKITTDGALVLENNDKELVLTIGDIL